MIALQSLQSLQFLCSAKLQSPENSQKWAALQSLQSGITAKPSKTLGFLRFAALQSLHSPTGRQGRCKAGPSLSRGDARPSVATLFFSNLPHPQGARP